MKKILIIEDDRIMRENTAEMLELAGYDVHTAENGHVGSVKASSLLPDLILCDIMMPELDGYGVLYTLSKNPETSSIPFIFLSAKVEKKEIRKAMVMGADDYLTKPFEEDELLKVVEVRLKKAEILKRDFSQNAEGIKDFFQSAEELVDLKHLTDNKSHASYKKKQVIYDLGETPEYLYFINEGTVKTIKTHNDGKEFITNIFKTGDFFGHIPLIKNVNYYESAIVQEQSEICKIPKQYFLDLIYKNREVASKFIRLLSSQIDEQEKQMIRLAYDSVRKRTAEALILLSKQTGCLENQNSIRVTREDLANMVGTAPETVIRSLSELREDGLIEICGREIKILDLKKIASIP